MPAVNREEFLRKLQSISPGLSPREAIEQSSCFVFKDGKAKTYNDEIAVTINSGLDPKLIGAAPAEFVLDALQNLRSEEVEVYPKTLRGKYRLIIKGRNQTYKVAFAPDVLLPYDEIIRFPTQWNRLPPEFGPAIGIVARCTHEDETQDILVCVHIHPERMEANDTFHAARFLLSMPVKKSLLVRGQSLKPLSALGVTYLGESKDWIHFANDKVGSDLVYSCRCYYQDYQDLTKAFTLKGTTIQLPKGLEKALVAAEVASKENADDNLVRIFLRDGRVQVRGEGVKGEYYESLKVNYTGPAVEFRIPPSLMAEIVREHNEVKIQTSGENWKIGAQGEKWEYVTALEPPQHEENGNEE